MLHTNSLLVVRLSPMDLLESIWATEHKRMHSEREGWTVVSNFIEKILIVDQVDRVQWTANSWGIEIRAAHYRMVSDCNAWFGSTL